MIPVRFMDAYDPDPDDERDDAAYDAAREEPDRAPRRREFVDEDGYELTGPREGW